MKFINNFLHEYRVSEKTEWEHAAYVTLFGTAVVLVLLGLYALLDFLHPAVVVNEAGKLVAVKDHWSLARSLLLKTASVFVGMMVMGWGVLIFNHITPSDYLKKAGYESIACAILLGVVVFGVVYMWCFG